MKVMDFSPANCKNFYKCVRNCNVKAIQVINDQATICEDRCIACGECFVVCPQNARNIKSDVLNVKTEMNKNKVMIASVAPSHAAIYNSKKFVTGLKKLGFAIVEETAVGAEKVLELYNGYIKNTKKENIITSCCPSVNQLIEKYYPNLIEYLIPVESPMITHAKLLKQKYGNNSFITFIGPCISKKLEAVSDESLSVDAVLSFEEVNAWLESDNIKIDCLEESNFELCSSKDGETFPKEGGIIKGIDETIIKRYQPLSVCGLKALKEFFEDIENKQIKGVFIEANACEGGCIGGPAISKNKESINLRKINLDKYIDENKQDSSNNVDMIDEERFHKDFKNKELKLAYPSEENIKEILRSLGKYQKSDELNCGACGYNTCIEKAIAVYQGMSHPEMCMPHMRSKAERVTNTIFEHSPNIIFIIDEDLKILELNPRAEEVFFIDAKNAKGKYISYLLDDKDFKWVIQTGKSISNKKVSYLKYGVVLNENIMYLKDQKIIMAIFHNLTDVEKKNDQLVVLKQNALDAAQNVIDKQMRVAQEIASLLGETTAETKIILTKLKEVVSSEEGDVK